MNILKILFFSKFAKPKALDLLGLSGLSGGFQQCACCLFFEKNGSFQSLFFRKTAILRSTLRAISWCEAVPQSILQAHPFHWKH